MIYTVIYSLKNYRIILDAPSKAIVYSSTFEFLNVGALDEDFVVIVMVKDPDEPILADAAFPSAKLQ